MGQSLSAGDGSLPSAKPANSNVPARNGGSSARLDWLKARHRIFLARVAESSSDPHGGEATHDAEKLGQQLTRNQIGPRTRKETVGNGYTGPHLDLGPSDRPEPKGEGGGGEIIRPDLASLKHRARHGRRGQSAVREWLPLRGREQRARDFEAGIIQTVKLNEDLFSRLNGQAQSEIQRLAPSSTALVELRAFDRGGEGRPVQVINAYWDTAFTSIIAARDSWRSFMRMLRILTFLEKHLSREDILSFAAGQAADGYAGWKSLHDLFRGDFLAQPPERFTLQDLQSRGLPKPR